MRYAAYVVPTTLLDQSPPQGGEWHATTSKADPAHSLLIVDWYNMNAISDFENLPGVVRVGFAWELLPAAAAPLLGLFQDVAGGSVQGVVALPNSTAAPPSISIALAGISWPGAKMVR